MLDFRVIISQRIHSPLNFIFHFDSSSAQSLPLFWKHQILFRWLLMAVNEEFSSQSGKKNTTNIYFKHQLYRHVFKDIIE